MSLCSFFRIRLSAFTLNANNQSVSTDVIRSRRMDPRWKHPSLQRSVQIYRQRLWLKFLSLLRIVFALLVNPSDIESYNYGRPSKTILKQFKVTVRAPCRLGSSCLNQSPSRHTALISDFGHSISSIWLCLCRPFSWSCLSIWKDTVIKIYISKYITSWPAKKTVEVNLDPRQLFHTSLPSKPWKGEAARTKNSGTIKAFMLPSVLC